MEGRGKREGGVAATGHTNTVEHLNMDTLIPELFSVHECFGTTMCVLYRIYSECPLSDALLYHYIRQAMLSRRWVNCLFRIHLQNHARHLSLQG